MGTQGATDRVRTKVWCGTISQSATANQTNGAAGVHREQER